MHQSLGEIVQEEDFTNHENLMREEDTLLPMRAWALKSAASIVTGCSLGHLVFD